MKTAALPSPPDGPLVVGRVLLYADDLVARWMEARMDEKIIPPYTAFGVVGADGQIAGGVLFNQVHEGNIELSVVAPGNLSRRLFRVLAAYAFGTHGAARVTARTRASSLRVRRVIEKAGFQQEGVLRSYYHDGDDAVLYGLLKSECRW